MAGNYYNDPRPFYGLNHHNLISMDELFYGRREPPPWYMHQMAPGRFDDYYRSRSMDLPRHDQYVQREDQFREYRRPDMRDDVYIGGYQHDMHGANKGQQKNLHHGDQFDMHGVNKGQQKNSNQGGHNNHGGNNQHVGNNNHGGNNGHGHGDNNSNKGKKQQKHQLDSDDEDDEKSHKGNANKGNTNHGHGHNKSHSVDFSHGLNRSWSDNLGFNRGRGHGRHRKSMSLTRIVLKKLGLRDDSSSSDSSDDDRRGNRQNKKGAHGPGFGHGQMKTDHKPYTVRFDDQFYGHANNKKGGEKLGEDHGSHNKKGGGHPQGILKAGKNKHGDGYGSDEGHTNHGNGKGGNHGGAESGKKAGTKLGRAQSMDFRVNLCCENCERKVKKALWKLDVDEVHCDPWINKVVVSGNAKPENVLKKLRSVKKDTLLWHQHK